MDDVIIIGGGLAGLSAALDLKRQGVKVRLIEKKNYPRHKVCGEYLSAEVIPYLQRIGIDVHTINPNKITRFIISSPSGQSIETKLPLGGAAISRYALDNLLYNKLLELNASVMLDTTVKTCEFESDSFKVTTTRGETFSAKVVLGCFGKTTNLAVPNTEKTLYVGIKQYYKHPFPENLVVLHNFSGGYCGAVQVENGLVDVAYLVEQKVMRKYKNPKLLETEVMGKNPLLLSLFKNGEAVHEKPFAVSNITLGRKQLIQDNMLLVGDAAGMIPPASGNGMAMAIHSGKIVAESVHQFLIGKLNRHQMELTYTKMWNKHFKSRLFWGGFIQKLMGSNIPAEIAMRILQTFPSLLPRIVKQTHGTAI